MTQKTLCLIGLLLFVTSYIMFSQGAKWEFAQKPIDFAHWFNLIGAVLLISFNKEFPKNKIHSLASFLTILGIIAHIGLCTIDFIMWSYGDDEISKAALGNHISNTPSIMYPFIIVGPSLLFLGLLIHAANFIKTNPIPSIMVIIAALATGISYFIFKNGLFMALSCVIFAIGLALLLYRENHTEKSIQKK